MQFRLVLSVLLLTMATATTTAATERRILCSFDRMAGFRALDGKTERTRADLPVSWSITYAEGEAGSPGKAIRQRSGTGVELQVIETPSTLNWQEIVDMGGLELTTVYKQVIRSPKRYLAVQVRTEPALSGANPELSIGTCRIDPPF